MKKLSEKQKAIALISFLILVDSVACFALYMMLPKPPQGPYSGAGLFIENVEFHLNPSTQQFYEAEVTVSNTDATFHVRGVRVVIVNLWGEVLADGRCVVFLDAHSIATQGVELMWYSGTIADMHKGLVELVEG